jgi:iron-sulfur cluster assembly protein
MDQLGIHGDSTQKRGDVTEQEQKAAGKTLTIDVTPAAVTQICKLDAKRRADGKSAEGLRIGLRGGGCDGFSYVFEWADKPADAKRDHVIELDRSDGGAAPGPPVRIFIDRKSMLYLAGTTLNFVTGLMGHGFKFENPNVKGSCGCGESVQF